MADEVESSGAVVAPKSLKIKGGPSVVEAVTKSTTITLTFVKPEELEVYNAIVAAAEDKDYTASKYVVRILTGKETFGTV